MPKFEEWSPWVARSDLLHAPLTGAHLRANRRQELQAQRRENAG
ncbi:hypothetical protein N9X88_02665 [Alphaproteobacteria bacterium]|nr:hypothetical protein [Alphaproteobacteria bacterium]